MPRARPSLLLLSLAQLLPGALGAQGDVKDAHGVFTGDIKAVVYVADVERSAPFYRDVLGFSFEGFADLDEEPYYAEMAAGGTKFGLHEPTSAGQEPKVGRQRLYFRVRDLAVHRSRVAARGGDPGEVITTGWMDFFVVTDPDGNEIVFAVTAPAHHRMDPWHTAEGEGTRHLTPRSTFHGPRSILR